MTRGHTPIRQCIGCRKRRPKSEMIRLETDGKHIFIAEDKSPGIGRGCYMCPVKKCMETAVNKGRILKALRLRNAEVPTIEELLSRLGEKG